jgi:hypothetical protein
MRMRLAKRSILNERIKRVRKDLSDLDRQIRSIEKTVGEGGLPPVLPKPRAPEPERYDSVPERRWPPISAPVPGVKPAAAAGGDVAEEQIRRMREDKRFANYLASSFQTMHPLRNERRLQRNKALVMVAFVILILFLLLWFIL